MNARSWLLRVLAAFALSTTAGFCASVDGPTYGVAVKIWGSALSVQSDDDTSGFNAGMYVLPNTPGGSEYWEYKATETADRNNDPMSIVLGDGQYVRMEPGKSYELVVGGWAFTNGEINVLCPPGYRVKMDGVSRSRKTFDYGLTIMVEIVPEGGVHPGLAGMASGIPGSEIEWRVSLGSLRNGGSAGDLALIDRGTRSSWTPIFLPGLLSYEAPADEIAVYRPNNVIRQIIANQVVLDVVPLPGGNPTYYEIRCYHPTQMQGTSDPRTFTGSPFVTYRVEQGATATTLKITKEVRNVTDATSNFTVARTEYLQLKREDNWPAFKWTRTDWSTNSDPAAALGETYVSSTGPDTGRTETISIRVPGSSTPVTSVSRTYTVPLINGTSVLGELVASETVGTSQSLSSSFSYYTDPSQFGSLGFVKNATLPGGNWVAFDYYSGNEGGRIKYQYRPYVDTPGTIPTTLSASVGQVTYYEYTADVWGAQTRPILEQTSVNGTVVAKVTTARNLSDGTANGYAIARSTRSEHSGSTSYQQTVVRYYREDASHPLVRGQTYSVSKPNGVKESFVYQLGTWDGSAFYLGSGYLGSGTASRIAVITGNQSASGGTVDSYQADLPGLVDGKSTKEVTIRDSRSLVVRTESHIWRNYAWQLVTFTSYTYDYAGRLTSRVGSNGATYSATYDGGLKSTETDEAGVTTSYTYDIHGRVSVATRSGSGVIGALATKYTYDAAGRIVKEEVGYGQSSPITTQRQYDNAGRVTLETPPGSYGVVSYAYDVSARTQTATRADNSTVIKTANLDGRPGSVTGTGTVAEYHTYGVETSTAISGQRWHKVNSGTATSARWVKSWQDWLGREVKSERPGFTGQDNVVTENFFNASSGLLGKSTKVGFAATLYEYNSLGQLVRSGLDVDGSGALTLASDDRITETESYLESYNGAWWMRSESRTYPKLGLNTVVVTSVSRTRLTGHATNRLAESQAIDAEGNVTTQTVDVNRSNATGVATTTRSGLANSLVENTVNGLSVSVTGFDGLVTSKGYDSYLRPSTVTDSRGNTTTTTYLAGTAMVSTVTNAAGNQAVTTYDTVGRVSTQRDPRNYYTRFSYNARGQLYRQWGDGTMPVSYGYDSTFGDRTTMSTYRGGSGWDGTSWPGDTGTADTTTWTFDGPSGLLTAKTDALNRAVTQTYNTRGQTATRTLARGVATTYGYDAATGELLSQSYSDNTPSVTYTYGRTGQVESVTDFTGTRDLVYDANKPWRLVAEAQSNFYGNRVMSRLYDESGTVGRVRGFQLGAGASANSDLEQTFGFTDAGRFETIASSRSADSGTLRRFRYGYLSNAPLLQSLAIDQGAGPGGHPFTVTRTYETQRDVVTNLESKWSTTLRTGYAYVYDERGQRSKVVQSGDVFADYGDVTSQQFGYNGRGELTGAIGYLGSDITDTNKQLPGRRHEYGYDVAGNRQWSNRTGVTALRDDYTTNELNQYVARENNTVPVSGTAEPDNGGAGGVAVAVQGGTLAPVAAGRQGRYWNDEVTVNNNANPNSPNPWRGALTVFTAKRGTSGSPDAYRVDSRLAEIAARLQSFGYDYDGNLTGDGVVEYQWDAENRLIRMETTATARTWGFPHRVMEFRYDYMGRRVQKRVIDGSSSTEILCRRFLYDGWNLVAEYAAPGAGFCGALLRSYTWGLDIVSSLANAGGVGALLQIADHPSGKTYLPTYDGNGNIAALINASSGAAAAVYEYSPYGESLRAQTLDSTVADNPFRFSTKWTDLETGLVYYGHRYYDPKNGRFINRDPIEESGGLNLYGFCRNDAVNRWDYLGWAAEKPKLNVDSQSGGDWNVGDTYTNNGVTFTVGDGINGFGGYANGDGLSGTSGSGSSSSSLGLGSGSSGSGFGGGNIGDGGSGGDGPSGGGVVLSSGTSAVDGAGTTGGTAVNATTASGAAPTSANDGAAATATVVVVTPSVTTSDAGSAVGSTTTAAASSAGQQTGSPLAASATVNPAANGTTESAADSQPASTEVPDNTTSLPTKTNAPGSVIDQGSGQGQVVNRSNQLTPVIVTTFSGTPKSQTLSEIASAAKQGAVAGVTGAPGLGLGLMVLGGATTWSGFPSDPYRVAGGITMFSIGVATYAGGLVYGTDWRPPIPLPETDTLILEGFMEARKRQQDQANPRRGRP